MTLLRLYALDADELPILSAHLQDAVMRVSDMTFSPRDRRFVFLCNRYNWQLDANGTKSAQNSGERRRSAVRVERVTAMQSQGFNPKAAQTVLSVLAVQFTPDPNNPPSGSITFYCAGAATLRLTVECPEMVIEDLGPAWQAIDRPSHPET